MADSDSREGKTYISKNILEFCEKNHAVHDVALEQAFRAAEIHGVPSIQVSPLEGKFLQWIFKLQQVEKVVEIGTLAGYSTLWIANALSSAGTVWTIEADRKHAQIARSNFEQAGFGERITVLEGDAKVMLEQLESKDPFDAVFIDADKASYLEYAKWAHTHLKSGGLLIGDNAFLFGNLLEDTEEAASMQAFHQFVGASFDSVCLPTPDGMVLGVKKS